MRKCEVCGRTLKTGRKYCYVCRSIQKAGGTNKKDNHLGWITALTGITFFVISLFLKNKFMSVFGWIGLLVGFPLSIALILKHFTKKAKERKEIKNSS